MPRCPDDPKTETKVSYSARYSRARCARGRAYARPAARRLHRVIRDLPEDPRAARLESHKLVGSLLKTPLDPETARELAILARVLARALTEDAT